MIHILFTVPLKMTQDMNIDAVRADLRFALTCQPGEGCAAIDGDAYTILKLSFFARKVPPAWLDEIHAKLWREHVTDWNPEEGTGTKFVNGVCSLQFHYWVARTVMKVDDKFQAGADYHGRGRNASAILESLTAWAHAS